MKKGLNRFFADLKKYLPFAEHLAKAELKTEVEGSYLSWLWWVLEPICYMLVYAFVFGVIFNSKEKNFPLFIFIGITMFQFFRQTVTQSVKMIHANKSLLQKVYIPKFIFIVKTMLVNGFKMLVSFGIIVIMMVFYRVKLTWKVFYVIPLLLFLFVFTYAVSTFMLHLGVYIKDLANAINILLRLLNYFTGVFFDIMKRVPSPYNQWVLRCNPVAAVIVSMRNVLLYDQPIHWKILALWSVLAVVLAILGTRLIYKNENNYAKVI